MFNLIPDILYNDKLVKNFFRKVKLRDDAYKYTTIFKTYSIKDNETPEDVSFKFYNDINYYWIILLINDIQNVSRDWHMPETVFEEYIAEKYPDDLGISTKHYVTKEIVVNDQVILEAGLVVEENFEFNYNDTIYTNITVPVTYREWEYELNEEKRSIFILKNSYVLQYQNEFEKLLRYETQYGINNGVRINNV